MNEKLFTRKLKDAGKSSTASRMELFRALAHTDHHIRPGQVAGLVKNSDRASVYRNLNLFEKLGITKVITIGWRPYVELSEPFKPHHHHMICKICGNNISFDNHEIERVIQSIAQGENFLLEDHNIELTGVCSACQRLN